jgi:hypothetical protein
MNAERAVRQGPLRPTQPNQRNQDLAEADAMVESQTRYVSDPDAPPPSDDDQTA